ncbi:M-phase inducer phosphatase-like isoform X2 [Aphidius gifuensis]|uniref:M-phase inducer phosphatase-like isoform X2 n=1 Tax=Aphidius gifuensis TaxID=684658 RepID=UPI001CDD6B9C|nr:M-phase inducer phosphatase-like isoform X2 [Aphidius gifuensis]
MNRLFKTVLKIRNTPGRLYKSKRTRRFFNMGSKRVNSTPEVEPGSTPPSSMTASTTSIVDKENVSAACNLFAMNSSPQTIVNKSTSRYPLEDCDPNSQDSGYGASFTDDLCKFQDGFRFAEPSGFAPRRMSIDSARGCSPQQSPIRLKSPRTNISCSRDKSTFMKKLSSCGYDSMDDGFNELIDIDNFMENTNTYPINLNNLISGDIVSEKPMECDASTTPKAIRIKTKKVRRSLSLKNDDNDNNDKICTPPLSKIRSCLFRSPNSNSSIGKLGYSNDNTRYLSPQNLSPLKLTKSVKRSEPPTDASPLLVKKSKRSCSLRDFPDTTNLSPIIERINLLQRCHSETEAHANIKSAIHRSTTDADLTGDFSKTCILPLSEGSHDDLKSIASDTLEKLIHGEFDDRIASYQIVDCRYPYEYEAGHIEGALNLYTKELIEQHLMKPINKIPVIQPETNKRHILIFHCEFSWERGPNLSRYLRNIDRKLNKEHYPALYYPEIYILHGGYQQFYRDTRHLCSPQGYRPMNHPDHDADLRKFRSKSKSWQGEKTSRGLPPKSNLKRLGF